MDAIWQGIPHTICYLDDLLVTEVNDAEHLHNLADALNRLQHHGVHLKMKECCFLHSVDYLGHHVNARGIHAYAIKVEAILKAPTPTNVTGLNYYGKFLQNFPHSYTP